MKDMHLLLAAISFASRRLQLGEFTSQYKPRWRTVVFLFSEKIGELLIPKMCHVH